MKKIPKLNKIFQSNAVKIAYLFGSQKDVGVAHLSGKNMTVDKASDLDIGVVFDSIPRDIYKVYGKLYSELDPVFRPFILDLVFIQETDPLFQYEVIQGYLLFSDEDFFSDNYEERVLKFASDLSFKKEQFQQEMFEAVKDGYFEITLR